MLSTTPDAPSFAMGYNAASRPKAAVDVVQRAGTQRGYDFHSEDVITEPKHTLQPWTDPPSKILDFLYLGNAHDALNATFLAAANITTVINLSNEEYWSVLPHVVVRSFNVADLSSFPISNVFQDCSRIIDKVRWAWRTDRSSSILVHCQKGKSRSATVVAAYLIDKNGWTVAETLDYLTLRRPIVEPNLGFVDQLKTFQEGLGSEARTLARGSLCIAVRQVSCSTRDVWNVFEELIGPVFNVTVRPAGPSNSSPNLDELDDGVRVTTALVFFSCAENVLESVESFRKGPEKFLKVLGDVGSVKIKPYQSVAKKK